MARRGLDRPAVPGAASAKAYRCPGCDQEIVPGTPHIVASPADGARMAGGVGWRSAGTGTPHAGRTGCAAAPASAAGEVPDRERGGGRISR